MKILWVKSDFLHPTTRGGQIRTLEMLRRLHQRHEIHYVAFDDPNLPEGLARSGEYCSRAYPIAHAVPPRRSVRFAAQLVAGLAWREPVSIRRYRSVLMRRQIERLSEAQKFDSIVCDFLAPAVNVPAVNRVILFQHNVESLIWERHVQNASNVVSRLYFRRQARLMRGFERRTCLAAKHVVAVSPQDRQIMEQSFGVSAISDIPTGVDVTYFAPPGTSVKPVADLVFVGSMDWLPNIDAMRYFVCEILPLIRRNRPNCSLAIVGRRPGRDVLELTRQDTNIHVTGTVDDVRPYLWGSTVSIVPLRIGGGTRLKIYEAMAAGTPVVSTTVGAEGLQVAAPANIRLADTPQAFAAECLAILENTDQRNRQASNASNLVSTHFSWETVARQFETILSAHSRGAAMVSV